MSITPFVNHKIRKVIFEDPLCLNDKDIITDELLVQKEADYLSNNHNINNDFSNKTGCNLENINDDIELIDLKGKVSHIWSLNMFVVS